MRAVIGFSLICSLALLGGCSRSVHYSSGYGGASLAGYGPGTYRTVCDTDRMVPRYGATTVHRRTTTTWTYGSLSGYRSPYGTYRHPSHYGGYRSPYGTYRRPFHHGGYRSPFGTYRSPHRRTPHCPH